MILRLHQHTQYTEEIKRNIRSIIQELALYTGAEYAVFMLVEIKDENRLIWNDVALYEQAVKDIVPLEFQNITVLWNMFRWRDDYPGLPDRMTGVHLSQWLPIQYFRKWYPEFEYFWNWEMDVRFTGHHYDLVKSVSDFAAAQPRKGLWERNSRFYIPQLHGTYDQFRDLVQSRYEGNARESMIWGPHPPKSKVNLSWHSRLNVTPPTISPDDDSFVWGVNEQADLITFLPMFNPAVTNYVYRDMYTNYDSALESADLSRRATIITFVRVSSRLLQLMEAENTASPAHHMSSELWPHSLSLHYGLKAVYVPHAIYLEQDWPLQALDFVFNNGDQESVLARYGITTPGGEGAGGPESVFGLEREHNWDRSTWYYRNRLARKLFKRWLGWNVEGIGGRFWERNHGRYCLPPMLLHPIKSVEDPSSGDEVYGTT